jgi:hypothetical protein
MPLSDGSTSTGLLTRLPLVLRFDAVAIHDSFRSRHNTLLAPQHTAPGLRPGITDLLLLALNVR